MFATVFNKHICYGAVCLAELGMKKSVERVICTVHAHSLQFFFPLRLAENTESGFHDLFLATLFFFFAQWFP